jgi:hypothetical protein
MGFTFETVPRELEPLEKVRNELYGKILDFLRPMVANKLLLLPWITEMYRSETTGNFGIKIQKWMKLVMTIEPFFTPTGQVAYRINSPIMDNHEVKFKLAKEKLGDNRIVDSVEGVLSAVRWGSYWTPAPRKSHKQVQQERKVYLAQAVECIDLRDD